jgi:hypothetical protein
VVSDGVVVSEVDEEDGPQVQKPCNAAGIRPANAAGIRVTPRHLPPPPLRPPQFDFLGESTEGALHLLARPRPSSPGGSRSLVERLKRTGGMLTRLPDSRARGRRSLACPAGWRSQRPA